MAESCLAAVFVGAELPLEVQEFPVPDVGAGQHPGADEAWLRSCGTDAHNWYNPNAPHPIIWGHENIGVVAGLGANVRTDILGETLREGDRRAVPLCAVRPLLQLPHGAALHECHPLWQLARRPLVRNDAARRIRPVPAAGTEPRHHPRAGRHEHGSAR